MSRWRIVETLPSTFVIERKGWFGWMRVSRDYSTKLDIARMELANIRHRYEWTPKVYE